MNHQIKVIYPAQAVIEFVLEADFPTEDILEMVFARFNNGSGMEYKDFLDSRLRSLSVNDIVGVDGRLFQCQSSGWKEVDEQYVAALEDEVRNNLWFVSHGPWFALSEVMWKREKE
jgi:hypothetical protein